MLLISFLLNTYSFLFTFLRLLEGSWYILAGLECFTASFNQQVEESSQTFPAEIWASCNDSAATGAHLAEELSSALGFDIGAVPSQEPTLVAQLSLSLSCDPATKSEMQGSPSSPSTFLASGSYDPQTADLLQLEIKEPHTPKWQSSFLPAAHPLKPHVTIPSLLPSSTNLSPLTLSVVKSVIVTHIHSPKWDQRGACCWHAGTGCRRATACPGVCRNHQSSAQVKGVFPSHWYSYEEVLCPPHSQNASLVL